MSEYVEQLLKAVSTHSSNPEELLQQKFDLLFCFPSWDMRSTCITGTESLSVSDAVVVLYSQRGSSGNFENNESRIRDFVQKIGAEQMEVQADSKDPIQVCGKICEVIRSSAEKLRRPLDVLIDLSTACLLYTSPSPRD